MRELESFDADIVCLQELTTHSAANPRRDIPAEIAALGYHKYYVQSLHNAETDMGNGIFSRLPIAGSRSVYVQHEDPAVQDYSRENRIYLETVLSMGQARLTIGTVHLSYAQEFHDTAGKERETNRLLEAIKGNRSRFVLTGDLNSPPGSYTVSALDKLLRPAGPRYGEATWTTKPFSYNGFEANTLSWRLDYAFTSPDIKVLDSRIMPTEASDHLPILTTLEI